MDSVSLISTVVSSRESVTANERKVAVAANAIRAERETMSVLMQAIQQSAAYGASGQPTVGGIGTQFSAMA